MRIENMLAGQIAKDDMKQSYSLEHAVGTIEFHVEITKITDSKGKVAYEKHTLAEIEIT